MLSSLLALWEGNPLFEGANNQEFWHFFLIVAWRSCWTHNQIAIELKVVEVLLHYNANV